jgi:hypothetical protein
MKTIVSAIALCSIVALPAFAKSSHSVAPDAQWASRVHVYAAEHYAPQGTRDDNADFQLGGER